MENQVDVNIQVNLEETSVMRLAISGTWTVNDMVRAMQSLDDLYGLTLEFNSNDSLAILFRIGSDPQRLLSPDKGLPDVLWKTTSTAFPPQREPSGGKGVRFRPATLQIRRIEFASPGFIDIAGVGTAIGHVKDFIQFIIQHWSDRTYRKLRDEEKSLQNERLRIENAMKYVELANGCGLNPTEIRRLTNFLDERQDILTDLVAQDKLSSVSIVTTQEDG